MFKKWRRHSVITAAALLVLLLFPHVARAVDASVNVSLGVGETTVLMQGTTSPHAQVTVLDGSNTVGTVTSNASGIYSHLLHGQAPGLHAYQLYAQDSAGRLTDTITVSVSVLEHSQTIVTAFLPPTIKIIDNEVPQGTAFVIEGMSAPSSSVVVYVDDQYFTVAADALGAWALTVPSYNLQVGEHRLYTVATKIGGEQSYPSGARTLIVLAPSTEVSPPAAPQTPSIGSPRSGTIISGDTVELSGTAEPGTQIEIWNRDRLIGSVFADSNGAWRLRISLTESIMLVKVRACRDGVCSDFTPVLQLLRQTPAALQMLQLSLSKYRMGIVAGDHISFKLFIEGGTGPYKVSTKWGNGQSDEFTSKELQHLLTHRYDSAGSFDGTVTVTDSTDESVQVYFSVAVAEPEKQPQNILTTLGQFALWAGVAVGVPTILVVLYRFATVLLSRRAK